MSDFVGDECHDPERNGSEALELLDDPYLSFQLFEEQIRCSKILTVCSLQCAFRSCCFSVAPELHFFASFTRFVRESQLLQTIPDCWRIQGANTFLGAFSQAPSNAVESQRERVHHPLVLL